MIEYAIKRIIFSIPTVLAVVLIVFMLIHLAPGNPVDILVGENASSVMKTRIVKEYALDKPIITQAAFFLKNVFVNGGGNSIYYNKPCFSVIKSKFKNTLFLGIVAFLIAILLSFSLSFLSVRFHKGIIDKVIVFFATIGMSIPSFWLGILLLLAFSVKLKIFPVSGTGGFYHVFLPALTLSFPMGSYLIHIFRNELLNQIDKRFTVALKTRGIREYLIFFKHIVKNALIPVVTVLFLQLGFLLTGAIITETIFSWDGIGLLLIKAINIRDYPLVQSLAIFIAIVYIYSNLIGDFLIGVLDRRVSFEKRDL
ncbi:peptide/nickel transport system permease protein [Thermotomaculum hydrothermale]|uniref:Peptide/nickel transport system permease protein n=1 Tax=Thermotomaculum hydrothermale TaxID=981385 RepID=A0A7R6SZ62_9BACT|nr:ABC transporter permease [Thermotomaculum hydrothermale]BBB33415.1 peptide/nickel transport system permease protein [Thermotomaculum hydrothermale]